MRHYGDSLTREQAEGNLRRADKAVDAVMVFGRATSEEEVRLADLYERASGRWAPTFVGHGTADWTLPADSSVRLHEALQDAGAVSELHLYANQIHEFDAGGAYLELVQQEASIFIRQTVVEPRLFRAEQLASNPFMKSRSRESAIR